MDAPPSIRLREPAGERRLDAPLVIGGADDDLVRVPGAADADALRLEWRGDGWIALPARGASAALLVNGERLAAGGHELREGDVFAVGAARVVALRLEPASLELDVRHLVGNDTIAPLGAARARADADEGADAEIVAAALDLGDGEGGARADEAPRAALRRGSAGANRRLVVGALAVCAVVLAFLFGIVGRLQRVAIEVDPGDVEVSAASLVSWYSAPTLFVLPGEHAVRGERAGYAPLVRKLDVRAGQPARLALRLTKLPGLVAIDTGGVAAIVTVDGAEAGRAPGELSIAAGARTLTLRAERHLDVVQKLDVEGGGARQELAVRFQPSWGKLAVSVTTPGATVAVDGAAPPRPLPATLDLPAGVHRLAITAPGAREWASSVLVKAGETTTLGPLTLGAPDARLVVRSQPSGAEVTVAGAFRGRTPLQLELPGGTDYDVLVTRAGYATWQRRVAAQPGAALALDARLEPILAALTIRGEPADAEVFVDGGSRGRTPATLQLLATRHQVEVRRAGSQPFLAEVDLTPALARTIDYALTPEGRGAGLEAAGRVGDDQGGPGAAAGARGHVHDGQRAARAGPAAERDLAPGHDLAAVLPRGARSHQRRVPPLPAEPRLGFRRQAQHRPRCTGGDRRRLGGCGRVLQLALRTGRTAARLRAEGRQLGAARAADHGVSAADRSGMGVRRALRRHRQAAAPLRLGRRPAGAARSREPRAAPRPRPRSSACSMAGRRVPGVAPPGK